MDAFSYYMIDRRNGITFIVKLKYNAKTNLTTICTL